MKHAIYPGSFDPPTLGHLDIIERAARLFDQVTVAIGRNTSKECYYSLQTRLQMLEACIQHLPNVKVNSFDGLLVEYAEQAGAQAIIRGLRATADFDYEFQIAMANRTLKPTLETVFLMTKADYSFVSSSVVKSILLSGGNYTLFVPPQIIEKMKKKS